MAKTLEKLKIKVDENIRRKKAEADDAVIIDIKQSNKIKTQSINRIKKLKEKQTALEAQQKVLDDTTFAMEMNLLTLEDPELAVQLWE